jgi:5-dehydro-2-deoxygluconokinase
VFDVDLLTVGRVNLDLYAQETGVEFAEVRGFDAMVGGSPVNVALAATRLGRRAAAFTAVGEDLVGDWVLRSLEREGVTTKFVARKPGPHTSLALRAQLSPDHPLAFFRHDPADIYLTVADAAAVPVECTRVFLVSADALARGSTADACRSLVRTARTLKRTIYLDLDLREVNWLSLDEYSVAVSELISKVDVVLGTEAEFGTLLRLGASGPGETVLEAVRERIASNASQVVIVKQGERGATALVGPETLPVDGYAVAEASSIGAGDSFAAGVICARLEGADWPEACDFASACAAITVSRFGCSSGFPRRDEVTRFIEQQTVVPNRSS